MAVSGVISADEGHILAPMFNPDGTLTHSAAYTVGDFWYGKNGIDTEQRILKNTVSATASFLKDNYVSKVILRSRTMTTTKPRSGYRCRSAAVRV